MGYCLFEHGLPEPLPDKRKMLHTFFLLTILGAGFFWIVLGSINDLQLTGLPDETVVYKYFRFKHISAILTSKKMRFNRVSSWSDKDSFEALFRGYFLVSSDKSAVVAVSDACEMLYGQSWTLTPNTMAMWDRYSSTFCLDNAAIMVKTTVGDIRRTIEDSVQVGNNSIVFNDRMIEKMHYFEEGEINEWFRSLGAFPVEKVQDYNILYAFLKRKKQRCPFVDFTIEDEVRCLAWGSDSEDSYIEFSIDDKLFHDYMIDPRLCERRRDKLKAKLIKLGVPGKIIC